MIVRWNLDDNFDSVADKPGFLHGVAEILRAGRLGIHLIILNRPLISRLLQLDLGAINLAFLEKLFQDFTQTGRLYELSTAYIQITNEGGLLTTTTGSAINVPFDLIKDSRILERTVLLVENSENDSWMYQEIFHNISQKLGRGHLSVDVTHGGGADTPKVLEGLLAQRRIVCAIADSDRDCPNCPNSITLSKMEKISEDSKWLLAKIKSPPCRELENVLPIEIVLQLQSALGNFSNSFLLNIQDREIAAGVAAEDHFWNHFDIKTGQSSEKILATHMNAQPWITQKLAIVGIGEENWVLPGYGENVISQVRGNGALVSEFRKMMALPLWNEKFAGFFSFLVWFFISSPRRVT